MIAKSIDTDNQDNNLNSVAILNELMNRMVIEHEEEVASSLRNLDVHVHKEFQEAVLSS